MIKRGEGERGAILSFIPQRSFVYPPFTPRSDRGSMYSLGKMRLDIAWEWQSGLIPSHVSDSTICPLASLPRQRRATNNAELYLMGLLMVVSVTQLYSYDPKGGLHPGTYPLLHPITHFSPYTRISIHCHVHFQVPEVLHFLQVLPISIYSQIIMSHLPDDPHYLTFVYICSQLYPYTQSS